MKTIPYFLLFHKVSEKIKLPFQKRENYDVIMSIACQFKYISYDIAGNFSFNTNLEA